MSENKKISKHNVYEFVFNYLLQHPINLQYTHEKFVLDIENIQDEAIKNTLKSYITHDEVLFGMVK